MNRKTPFIIALVLGLLASTSLHAQMFSTGRWDKDETGTLVALKWSQLYYEANVGINLAGGIGYNHTADFLYFALGVGFPSQDNAWRFFLPEQKKPSNEEEAELYGSMNTDKVYAGKLGLGYIHYFNHWLGIYAQASWGFMADFSSASDVDSSSSDTDSGSKKTFIYNTVPVEAGVCLNLWKRVHLQAGATYMWKEIPIVTVGLGFMF